MDPSVTHTQAPHPGQPGPVMGKGSLSPPNTLFFSLAPFLWAGNRSPRLGCFPRTRQRVLEQVLAGPPFSLLKIGNYSGPRAKVVKIEVLSVKHLAQSLVLVH